MLARTAPSTSNYGRDIVRCRPGPASNWLSHETVSANPLRSSRQKLDSVDVLHERLQTIEQFVDLFGRVVGKHNRPQRTVRSRPYVP